MLPGRQDPLFDEGYYPATAGAMPPCPPLAGDAEADLVVVGAGFTGLAAALRAAEAGMRVIVLEAGPHPGHGASGRNGGQLIPGLRWDARTLLARLGRGRARDLFQLSLTARERVWARIADHAIPCDLTPGHATMAWTEAHYRDLGAEAECLARDFGHDAVDLVPRATARATIVGSDLYHGGLVDRLGGHFHPLNYALGLARAGLAAGAAIHAGTPASGWSEAGGGVAVTTARGVVRARHGLLAADTGMGSIDRARAAYAMPILNYNVATAPLSAEQAAALMPADMAVADTRFVLNYFRLSPDRRLIFGGGEKYLPAPPRDIDGFVRRHIGQVFPSLAAVPITHRWGGAVGVSVHRLPLVGRRGAMFHAHGFSGHGAILTTLAGEAVADAIAGEAGAFDLLAGLPARRFPGGGALRWPLHVAGMLYYAAKDRL